MDQEGTVTEDLDLRLDLDSASRTAAFAAALAGDACQIELLKCQQRAAVERHGEGPGRRNRRR